MRIFDEIRYIRIYYASLYQWGKRAAAIAVVLVVPGTWTLLIIYAAPVVETIS